jgi:hypothetical protein
MKKVIYIAVVAVGFFAVSCTKENIRPCTNNSNSDIPVWSSRSGDGIDDETGDVGGITDPNSDPDEVKRKKHL